MKTQNLTHLLYISDAARLFSDSELAELVTKAKANNARRQITGLLLYSSGHFIQLLEGALDEVANVYDRIRSDPRHRNAQRLLFKSVDRRLFPRWEMGLLNLDRGSELDRQRLQIVLDQLRRNDGLDGGKDAVALLREFRNQLPASIAA